MQNISDKFSMQIFLWKNALRSLSIKIIIWRKRFTGLFKAKARCCHIYKTNKSYKIVTDHRRAGGAYIAGQPVYILPLDSSIEDIAKSLFESLSKSGKISEKEYFNSGGTKEYLKSIKEKSLKQLYSTSNSCLVALKKNTVEITPYRKEQRWLQAVIEDKVTMHYSTDKELEITQQLLKVLEVSYNDNEHIS